MTEKKIVVAYKWATDPAEATVHSDGRLELSRAKPVVSEYDAVAIEIGRRLADASGAELVGVTVGGPAAGQPMATKSALARGLDRVLVVVDDAAASSSGSFRTAAALAAAVRAEGEVALLLAGDSSIDLGAKAVATLAGGLLGWPTITDATAVEFEADAVVVERIVPEGTQRLRASGPAVVAVATDAAQPRVPGMKDVLAAGRKPVASTTAEALGLGAGAVGTLLRARKLSGPARRRIVIDTADPAAGAAELIAALRAVGALERGQ